jgi:hypothetical protein
MAVLFACLILFAAAQYNDPDPQIWVPMYSAGAIWTGLAAFAPRLLRGRAATLLLLISVILTFSAVVYFWPASPNWWRQEVWWRDEEAREGMGAMILAACIALVGGYRLVARRGA